MQFFLQIDSLTIPDYNTLAGVQSKLTLNLIFHREIITIRFMHMIQIYKVSTCYTNTLHELEELIQI